MPTPSPSHSDPSIRTEFADIESLTNAVVTAVIQANDGTPATSLYEAIDPDALEDLYEHGSPKVTFEYIGYHVTIHPDRTVTVSELNT